MPEKRPYPDGDVTNGDQKRPRSGESSHATDSHATIIESEEKQRKTLEMQERIAAMKARLANAAPAKTSATMPMATPGTPPATLDAASRARQQIEALRAKVKLSTPSQGGILSQSNGSRPEITQASPVDAPVNSDRQAQIAARLAAVKARVDAQVQTRTNQARTNISMPPAPPAREDTSLKARGGLGIGLHPALMGDVMRSVARDGQSQDEKRRKTARSNPYLAHAQKATNPADEQGGEQSEDVQLGKARTERKSRAIVFNQKGKFIAQAEALRAQARLEHMKQEMQIQARKKAIEEATERSYLVHVPPDIEWWDEGIVEGSSYDSIMDDSGYKYDAITEYVQHPILIQPPQDKLMPTPKPMFMTKKEQAKQRRQERMVNHKEEQAKIRLGLIPPPPPKVKKSNLMRVLGQEAVKDPTAVEARVNRDIAKRLDDHEQQNEERKLTKEQRVEKLATQQENDAAKGLLVAVFRIENLSYGKHRFKIDMNAKQHNLTGTVILNPKMNLVIVEGGNYSVRKFKHLMLERVDWEENAVPIARVNNSRGNTDDEREGGKSKMEDKEWLQPLDENGRLKDLSHNKCTLVWEGEEKQRAFRFWNSKVCETDGEAKDALARSKMENMWTLAQSMTID